MEGKYFEDYEVGDAYATSYRVVSESDLRRFLDLIDLREPLFEDPEFLAERGFERWLVTGYLTMCFSAGLFSRSGWLEGTGLALLELDGITFENPVFVDDAIRVAVETIDLKPTSSEDGGVVTLKWRTENRDGDLVLTMTSTHFIKKAEI